MIDVQNQASSVAAGSLGDLPKQIGFSELVSSSKPKSSRVVRKPKIQEAVSTCTGYGGNLDLIYHPPTTLGPAHGVQPMSMVKTHQGSLEAIKGV